MQIKVLLGYRGADVRSVCSHPAQVIIPLQAPFVEAGLKCSEGDCKVPVLSVLALDLGQS